jgi:hypothetical protein
MGNHFGSIKDRKAFFEKLSASKKEAEKKPSEKPDETKAKCPSYKLAYLTVVQNATQTHVTGQKNWACLKKTTDEVIVQATTIPNTEEFWKKINWSGDSGDAVSGKPNQRKLSRAAARHYHVEAELGGVKDHVEVWVLWATVTILTSGSTPANAVQFAGKHDGTENLGAVSFDGGDKAAGRVVPVGTIAPIGIQGVVKSGWAFKRERMSHDWRDGNKDGEGNGVDDYWNTAFVDDTSYPDFQKLTPDNDDKIYDRDAPSIGRSNITTDQETYNHFRQWIEWNGEKCSDKAQWYWKARRLKANSPQITLKDVGTGSIALPAKSFFHP